MSVGREPLDVGTVADPADVDAALLVRPLDDRLQVRTRLEVFELDRSAGLPATRLAMMSAVCRQRM